MIDKSAWHVFLNEGSLQMVRELKAAGMDVEHILDELHQQAREYYLDQGYGQGLKEGPFEGDAAAEMAFNKGWEHGYAESNNSAQAQVIFDEGLCKGWETGYEEGLKAGHARGFDEGMQEGRECEAEWQDQRRESWRM